MNNKAIKFLRRYVRVKSHVKETMKNADLNTYVQELIQANRLSDQLRYELIKVDNK